MGFNSACKGLICDHRVWWERNFETEGAGQNIEQ